MRNAAWSFDECYLAVWIYDMFDASLYSGPKTALYSQVAKIIGRTEGSVEYKVQNVAAVDSRPDGEKSMYGLDHYQELLKKVFEWYWTDREASRKLYDLVVMRILSQK